MARTDAVALPPDTPAALRLAAEAVGLELGRVTSHFEALPPGHPHAAYADFARLYRSVTCRWLAHLAQQPEKLFPLRVIPPFFALYREHVLEALDRPIHRIAPHWQRYHRLTRSLSPSSGPMRRLLALSFGAYAHTHFDIGVAMRVAEERAAPYRHQHLFGRGASRAFGEAAQVTFNGNLVLRGTQPIWVPVLHHWRRSGYRRALRAEQLR